ncbi:hypothetical protein Ami103574_10510 [Aminipila butyrica]|uniref:Deacetylase sirtuin-type domain-containing protein n=1 Tax=Aminipila butyrica TaxID=433296 RepID=A0A858BVV9_9FIRM|nr:SIR2 family protein [Aminipila butyrica]QIB69727.1 hypothetical protein Ami103574_10510 [Aminipila butyrica]
MKKTVIFLGAGASKADGAPLQRELFCSYFQACEDEGFNRRYPLKHSKVKGLVDRYFKNFFAFEEDFNYRQAVFPTFEEALGILDLAIERNEKYRSDLGNLYKYRTALIFAMAQAIQYKIEARQNGMQGESHAKLIENLEEVISQGDITFISTNYDIILDNVLGRKFDVDYGFYHLDRGDAAEKSVKLLKIHGSLNWKYCPVCKCIDAKIDPQGTLSIVDNPGAVTCGQCRGEAQYIIVPPTYYKDMGNVYLTNIWNNAEKVLREADHIVFSGYSLPSADMHIKYLLKRAELNRAKENPFKATVINYFPDKINGAIQKEEHRYHRFFKHSSQIRYIREMSFQEFSKDPFQVLE